MKVTPLRTGTGNDPILSKQPTFTKPDLIQAVLDELFYQHGTHLPSFGGYEEILLASGIDKRLVTDQMIKRAKDLLSKRLKEELDVELAKGPGWKVVEVEGRDPSAVKEQQRQRGDPKPKKESRGKDRYGCTIGLPPSMINAVLTMEPQTIEKIAENSSLPVGRVKEHLRYWLSKTHGLGIYLVKTDAGWSVKEC